jgi:nitrogen fixation protein NifB
LDSVLERVCNIAVVGIAGPGDPLANPEETLQTMELVHEKYPEKILCLATNGLTLAEHAERLSRLNISHVTVTLNAVDPVIGAKIYAWVRPEKRPYRGEEGAGILFRRQTEGIRALKERGMTVKINTVVIPEINDVHVPEIAAFCRELGADVQNCIPMMHVEGTVFEGRAVPEGSRMAEIRREAGEHLRQMTHCARCRADAVGRIGQENPPEIVELLEEASAARPTPERPYVAVASMEGLFVNRHLGEAPSLWIFGEREGKITLLGQRPTPAPGTGDIRWLQLAKTFRDCAVLLVSGCGRNPQKILESQGLRIMALEGLIYESLPYIFSGRKIPGILKRASGICGEGCRGGGSGCG